MNKILFSADPDINYVFHMLSVAKCGYDNAYGEKYRGRYDPADMKCIKDQESHLTVRGGEHCGDWYGPMICEPARSGVTAKEYYAETIAWIESGNLDLPDDTRTAVNQGGDRETPISVSAFSVKSLSSKTDRIVLMYSVILFFSAGQMFFMKSS